MLTKYVKKTLFDLNNTLMTNKNLVKPNLCHTLGLSINNNCFVPYLTILQPL